MEDRKRNRQREGQGEGLRDKWIGRRGRTWKGIRREDGRGGRENEGVEEQQKEVSDDNKVVNEK